MASVDHPNLLQLLAVCMTTQIMLVTQLMPLGCLLDYVRNNKDKVRNNLVFFYTLKHNYKVSSNKLHFWKQ